MANTSTFENMIESLKDYLTDNLPAYIDLIDAAQDDGLILDDVKSIKTDDSDPYSMPEYPAIVIDTMETDSERIANGREENRLTVVIFICINSVEDYKKRIRRYSEAVRQLLRDYNKNGIVSWDVNTAEPINIQFYYPPVESVKISMITAQLFRADEI